MEYVTLMGSEKVESAGNTMRQAAEQMAQAAAHIDESLRLHRQWMDDWICRFEIIMARKETV